MGATRHSRATPEERFWEKVDMSGACWIWTGARQNFGYGVFGVGGKQIYAHRFSLEMAQGRPIPKGLQVDHSCHVPACVNPDHLKAVTVSENQENRAGASSRSTTGVRGVFKQGNRYFVAVRSKGVQYRGGTFGDIESAERAAIALRNKLMRNNIADQEDVA